jgi:succinate dehydrogenase / fumarate reductase cytochrome b subunit
MGSPASSRGGCSGQGCGCGGHGHAKAVASDPRAILSLNFGEAAEHKCNCSGKSCPRHYLAVTGFLLGGFLLLHLAVNFLALWPGVFQNLVSHNHVLGAVLPVLEIGLIFIPLGIHMAFGLRTLKREKLNYGVEKHHHGSNLRQWLQRVTAVILLLFLIFHIAAIQRWLGGRFDPGHAFSSASQAIWQFWRGQPAGSFPNLLFAQFYLLGLVAAVYHVANGIATGAEVLGLVETSKAQARLERVCLFAAPLLGLAGVAAWWALAVK